MRFLWSLPKAAPAILRHIVAYAELAAQDLERSQQDFKARLIAGMVLLMCIYFALFCGCVAIIALTWDTTYRLMAIGCMGGFFIIAGVIAALYRSNVVGAQAPFLGTVRKEWGEDRVLLEKILSDQQG